MFNAISIILDSESYKFLDGDIIYNVVKVIVVHFNIDHLNEELQIIFDDINRHISKSSAEKCWPIIFHIGRDLGIQNLLHILENLQQFKQGKVWRC